MKKLFALVIFALVSAQAWAVDGVSVVYGSGNSADMARVGALWNWDKSWFNDGDWHLTAYWEAEVGQWRGKSNLGYNRTITDVGLTPVFRFEQKNPSGIAPYFEGAIGIHLISPTAIYPGRDFGSSFQFGDHVGVGMRFGERRQFDIGYRYQHLSNGGIKKPNNGINFNEIHLAYRF